MLHGSGRMQPMCYTVTVEPNSYVSAITEKITGRTKDTCPDMPQIEDESTGKAKNDMGNARMDIFRSELACEGSNFEQFALLLDVQATG